MKTALALLLLAVPLSAQQTQTTVVPDVEITVNGDTIVVNVEVMSDSVRLARIADAVEALAAAIAECGCGEQPTTHPVVRIGQGALVLAAFFIGFQVKRVADGYSDSDPSDSNGDSDPKTDDYPESK
jgi:hypothetical protein